MAGTATGRLCRLRRLCNIKYLQLPSSIVCVLRADERDQIVGGYTARHDVLGRRVHACARSSGKAVRHGFCSQCFLGFVDSCSRDIRINRQAQLKN
jgi:hypothetical protein